MYNYKYNGKELQETGMYDYGARFLMPDIGRFGTIDPRSQYTHESYSYVWNNPIFFTDPTGMTGEAFAHCSTCPKTPEFQPYIDDKENVYVYDSKTNTASLKVTDIQEVTLTDKAKSSDSGPGSLALAALLVSQADSPVPGPADVVAAGMLIYAGVWWTANQFTQPSYTTIADPSAGMGSYNAEADDTDVNGVTVPDENKIPRDSLNPPTKAGNAPTFKKDGKSVEIHHEGQNANGPFKEMHPKDHRGKGNYNKNHPKGQKPLNKAERAKFNNDRQKYWKSQYPNVK